MNTSRLTIHSIQTTLVKVPMRRALGTSAMRIDQAPLLLIDGVDLFSLSKVTVGDRALA